MIEAGSESFPAGGRGVIRSAFDAPDGLRPGGVLFLVGEAAAGCIPQVKAADVVGGVVEWALRSNNRQLKPPQWRRGKRAYFYHTKGLSIPDTRRKQQGFRKIPAHRNVRGLFIPLTQHGPVASDDCGAIFRPGQFRPNKRYAMKTLRLTPVLSAIALAAFSPLAGAAELIVPLYAYPTTNNPLWAGTRTAAATNPVTAVVNVNNGPDVSLDTNYAANIHTLRTAGVTLAGYVYTLYGLRPIAEVKTDIDRWGALYPEITQIFVDEQSDDLATLAYYQEIFSYAATKGYTRIFTNPGTQVDTAFTTSPDIAVTTMLYESKYTLWAGYTTPGYVAGRPAADFATIVYNCPTQTNMETAVALAKTRNFGYIYVTDDKGANPYDKIPTYWSAEKSAVYP